MSVVNQHKIKKKSLLGTVPLLRKEWRVSFEFKATSYGRGLRQILHMTIGGKGHGSSAKYGDRIPAIWTHPTRGFFISSAVNDQISYNKWFKGLLPTKGQWVSIEIGQELELSKMVYYIMIGGKRIHSVTNSKPLEFENVKVYSVSPWYSAVGGHIRNLVVKNKHGKFEIDLPFVQNNNNIPQVLIACMIGHQHSLIPANTY